MYKLRMSIGIPIEVNREYYAGTATSPFAATMAPSRTVGWGTSVLEIGVGPRDFY